MGEPKERGMLFSGPLVRAILEGRKTVTRRPMKPQPPNKDYNDLELAMAAALSCPFGKPGDRIWVRETWSVAPRYDNERPLDIVGEPIVRYRASSMTGWGSRGYWRPSMHMPRWASRITLEVTRVSAERLQDITGEQARAEGMPGPQGVLQSIQEFPPGSMALAQFRETWDSIYIDRDPALAWNSNPWVWAVEFVRKDDR